MPTATIAKDTIADLVTITGQPGSRTFTLKVPLDRWPQHLREKCEAAIRQIQRSSVPLKNDVSFPVCFCSEVNACRQRAQPEDLPDCPANWFGICAEATRKANDGTMTYAQISALIGRGVSRSEQLAKLGLAKLRRAMVTDPFLVEACQQFGVGQTMISSVQLAEEMRSFTP